MISELFLTTVISTAAAAAGTVAFALLFGVPRRFFPYCGIIGGAGWLLYSLLENRLSAAAATFFAAVLVMLPFQILCRA